MKFLKSIRFDPSDTFVFENAAEPNEWVIPGGFWFSGEDEDELEGKVKQAFTNGFLSLESFGFTTLATVSEIRDAEVEAISRKLSERLLSHFGAPSPEAALAAAKSELEYVFDMCADVPVNSVFALRREFDEEGQLRESFSLVEVSGEPQHTRVWEIVE